ncbi:enterochelin esterase [Streptomyces sp. URMC 123]|uniref:enterochelin esterase n=1 Tax=Streptomyces sp. URMC 123 TaxID=3423403 RepID=UPI003F194735
MRSPMLRRLAEAVREGDARAVPAFWSYAATTGTPLVEPADDPAYRLVTFVLRDDPERPATDVLALLHTVTDKDRHAGDLTPHLMAKVPGTDVWAITHRLRADHRASYQFHVARGPRAETLRTDRAAWLAVLDGAVPDPLNTEPPLPARDGRHPASVMSLPEAPAQPWVHRPAVDTASGTDVRGEASGEVRDAEVGGRPLQVYLPPGHRPEHGPYPVAVLLDGEMWGQVLDVGTTLDRLVAERRIPPTVALLVHTMAPHDRMADLSCSEPFVDFLADELLPWAGRTHGATPQARHTVVAGQSAGGLTAAFAALHRPDRFGNALSQSGSFWWPDGTEFDAGSEWLTRRFAVTERLPVRFHLEVGLQEWMLLPHNRHLRNVLEARGYEVSYREFNGGHDYACWRGGLADGLVTLLGGAPGPGPGPAA